MHSRRSKQKLAILRVLKGTTSHPDAEWIYERVREEIPHISLGTVYRNLKLLAKDGEILRLEADMLGRFDGNTEEHCHVRCDRCGAIIDAHVSLGKTLEKRVASETGFKVTHCSLEFSGFCQDCA